jgi:hypothetical protein
VIHFEVEILMILLQIMLQDILQIEFFYGEKLFILEIFLLKSTNLNGFSPIKSLLLKFWKKNEKKVPQS